MTYDTEDEAQLLSISIFSFFFSSTKFWLHLFDAWNDTRIGVSYFPTFLSFVSS